MKVLRILPFAVLASLCLLVASPLPAADDEPSKEDVLKAEQQAGDVADLATAYQLAAFAEKYNVPEAYIAAASLLRKVETLSKGKFGTITETPTDDDKKPITATTTDSDLSVQAEKWFKDAVRGAGKQTVQVQALVKEARARKYTDDPDAKTRAVGGPKRISRVIEPQKTHVYHIAFHGGVPAAVGLQGSGNLRFEVLTDSGRNLFNLVAATARYNWVPPSGKGGKFTFRVHNGTKGPINYTLMTN